ncbi:MAG: hypothetical protein LBH55_00440 [Mycoplasmataceae bacterium]|nr:hypothetical protein [Mycoplasmataceae bacterium]
MLSKNKNYKAELVAYKEKVWKMNLVYIEKELEFGYGNTFFHDKKYIRNLFLTKKKHTFNFIKYWALQYDEEYEVINPWRAYKDSVTNFIFLNCLTSIVTFPLIIATIILLSIGFGYEMNTPVMVITAIALCTLAFLISTYFWIITSIDMHTGIKKYKNQWDEILAKDGIFKPKKYITK